MIFETGNTVPTASEDSTSVVRSGKLHTLGRKPGENFTLLKKGLDWPIVTPENSRR